MSFKDEPFKDAVVFRVAQLFLAKRGRLSTAEIAKQVSQEFPQTRELTRESIYPLLSEAVIRGFLRLVPPINQQLTDKLIAKYTNLQSGSLQVIETAGKHDNAKVSVAAAGLALNYIAEIAKVSDNHPVGIGLGPGRATLDFCQEIQGLLSSFPEPIKLKLVAISAGCPPDSPEYSSISFFNFFPNNIVASKVGLFAETLVKVKDFEELKQHPGVKKAFEARDSIDVVVTSMGDFKDKDDLLSIFLDQSGEKLNNLRANGWVGNVQYRPYSLTGPVREKPGDLRAVTLFELEDLVRISNQKYKHVILIARQCGLCGRTRSEALLPLLKEPKLKVFSMLVMDSATAIELLRAT